MGVCKPPTRLDDGRSPRVIVVGASVRAAVWSAVRAGLAPYACDAFLDADLLELTGRVGSSSRQVNRFPSELIEYWSDMPETPWLYTGGMENDPELIDRLAYSRPLWGNPGRVVRRARDPADVQGTLARAGLPALDVRNGLDPSDSGRWMHKPLRSGGGIGVTCIDCDRTPRPAASRSHFFQRWIGGLSCGATFVAARGAARLLGVCEQLHGRHWPNAGEFHYAGSIGPLTLDAAVVGRIETAGNCLAREFNLAGVFGVDLILADGIPWVIEVNPRWPASAELVERATDRSMALIHRDACERGLLPEPSLDDVDCPERIAGKLILYASRELAWTNNDTQRWLDARGSFPLDRPLYADIPGGPQQISVDSPLMTVLADGASVEQVRRDLIRRKQALAAVT